MTASDSDTDSMELKDEESCSSMFQSSLICNRYLPYYSELLEEASELLAEIKVNLSRTVQKHELWPGALFWTNRLSRWVCDGGYGLSDSGCGLSGIVGVMSLVQTRSVGVAGCQ